MVCGKMRPNRTKTKTKQNQDQTDPRPNRTKTKPKIAKLALLRLSLEEIGLWIGVSMETLTNRMVRL